MNNPLGVNPSDPLLGLTPTGLFMGLSSTNFNLYFRVNSLYKCVVSAFIQRSWQIRNWTIFTMEQLGVMAGNFALSFTLILFSIFVHISGSIRPITLIWASLERSFPPA